MIINNKIDPAVAASIGSSIRMLFLNLPLLVFNAPLLDVTMNLLYKSVEVLTVVAISNLASDRRSTWIEGLMLPAVYWMRAIDFLLFFRFCLTPGGARCYKK